MKGNVSRSAPECHDVDTVEAAESHSQVNDRMKLDISNLKKMRRERANIESGVKDSIESATVSSCGNRTPERTDQSFTFQDSYYGGPQRHLYVAPNLHKGSNRESSLKAVGAAPADYTIKQAYA